MRVSMMTICILWSVLGTAVQAKISPMAEDTTAVTIAYYGTDFIEHADERRPGISLHVGVHAATFDSYEEENFEFLGAYHFGISLILPTAHRQLSIETGAFYMPKGMSSWGMVHGIDDQGNSFQGLFDADVQMYSLEIPLSLLYDINPKSNAGIYRLRLGGSIGIRMGGKARYVAKAQGRVIERIESSDREVLNQIFKQEDVIYSITTGIEYEIHNFRTSIHYMAGQSVMRHRLFGFTVGYRIL